MSGVNRSAELEQLIAEFEKSGLRELHVVRDGVEIYLSNDGNSVGLNTGAGIASASAVAPPWCGASTASSMAT